MRAVIEYYTLCEKSKNGKIQLSLLTTSTKPVHRRRLVAATKLQHGGEKELENPKGWHRGMGPPLATHRPVLRSKERRIKESRPAQKKPNTVAAAKTRNSVPPR